MPLVNGQTQIYTHKRKKKKQDKTFEFKLGCNEFLGFSLDD